MNQHHPFARVSPRIVVAILLLLPIRSEIQAARVIAAFPQAPVYEAPREPVINAQGDVAYFYDGGIYKETVPAVSSLAAYDRVQTLGLLDDGRVLFSAEVGGAAGIYTGADPVGSLMFLAGALGNDRPAFYIESLKQRKIFFGHGTGRGALYDPLATSPQDQFISFSGGQGRWSPNARYYFQSNRRLFYDDEQERYRLDDDYNDRFAETGILVRPLGITDTGIALGEGRRTGDPQAIYRFDNAANPTVIIEIRSTPFPPEEGFYATRSIAMTSDAHAIIVGTRFVADSNVQGGFRNTTGIWSTKDLSHPLIANGHAINLERIDNLQTDRLDGRSYSAGEIVVGGTLCTIATPRVCHSAIVGASGDTDFPPDPNDPPEDELVWTNNSGGRFSTSSNWDAGEVPNSTQVAVFDSSAGYAVQFDGAAQQTLRLKVEQGDVDFVTGSINVLQDSLTKPGVAVATGARLDVESGHSLESIYATVGQTPAGSAGPGVLGVSGDSLLTTQARLIVGDAGKGQLSITAGGTVESGSARIGNDAGGEGIAILEGAAGAGGTSSWSTGNLSVGYNGLGELRLLDGAVLASDDVYFGNLGVGRGAGMIAGSTWVIGSLTVGHRGEGELSVTDISAVTIEGDFHSGNSNNSFGDTRIAARGVIEVDQSVYLGMSGIGNLVVESGGRLTADDLHIGFYNDGDGDLTVRGAAGTMPEQFSEVTLAGGLIVGAQGSGFALFDDRAVVQSDYGVIGGSAEGTGTVTIRNDAGWDIGTTLYVGTASDGLDPNICDDADISYGVGRLELMGSGQLPGVTGQDLIVTGPDSSIRGTGTVKFATRLEQCAKIAPGNSPGTLTIDGDLEFRGGVLEVELSGLSSGQYDVLQVTGNADLSGGIVNFIFDGFLPQQGDQITFLETGGTLTLDDNMRYEYQGANDGFEFEVTTDAEGNLTFTANNDAIDLLLASTFE